MAERKSNTTEILIYGMGNNFYKGGIETYLIGLFRRMPEHTFDFICDFEDIAFEDEIISKDSRVFFIPAKKKKPFMHLIRFAEVLLRNPQYRSVYFNVVDAGCAFTAVVPRLMGRKVVVHSHNNDTEKQRLHKLFKPLLNLLVQDTCACSKAAADYMFTGRNKDKAVIIPNIINTGVYAFCDETRKHKREELGLSDKRILLHVGRITIQKNPFFLIELIKHLNSLDSAWHLVSVGTGDLEAEFRHRIEAERIGSFVTCLGSRSDVPEIMSAADSFVLPSLYEGFGIVAIEAQCSGLQTFVSERVPSDVAVTNLVHSVRLDSGADVWARQIDEAVNRSIDRSLYSEIMKHSVYDVSSADTHDRRLMELLEK